MPATITAYHTFTGGTKARATQVNTNFNNHRGTLVPINSDTQTASDNTHDLGSTEHRWARAYINVGSWQQGDVKIHHSFNGVATAGAGWMLCDGRQINQTTYDAEHGSGSWASDVGTAGSLLNKYLPDLISRYAVGVSATSQDGTSAITSVGNTANSSVFTHTHTHQHNHSWHISGISASSDYIFSADGSGYTSAASYYTTGAVTITGVQIDVSTGNRDRLGGFPTPQTYNLGGVITLREHPTSNVRQGATTGAADSAEDIQPDSIEFEFYMRII